MGIADPVVIRSADGRAQVAIGPGGVGLADARGERGYPRPTGAADVAGSSAPPGSVAALRAIYDSEPGRDGDHSLEAVLLVGQEGQVLDGVAWSGRDAVALERASIACALPLEWWPSGNLIRLLSGEQPVPAQSQVELRRPLGTGKRLLGGDDPSLSLVLGRRQVVVGDAGGRQVVWPRVGHGAPGGPAAARLRLYQYFDEGWLGMLSPSVKVFIFSVALMGLNDQTLCLIGWAGQQREVLWRAAFAVGLFVEHYNAQGLARPLPHELERRGVPVF